MQVEKNQKISFVIPAYNCAGTIEESVESIINGNFSNGDEIIIVNDYSTDNTTKILNRLKEKYKVICVIYNSENKGCPASRNIGISVAKNDLIFNLDSDNILVPGSIIKLKEYMLSKKADVAAFGALYYFQKDIEKISHKWIFPGGIMSLADFLAGPVNPGPAGNFLYTKKSWEEVGKYWEYGVGLHEAWGFSLKQLVLGSKFVVMPNSYYFHRYGHNSLFIRESKNEDGDILATKMIAPYLNLLDSVDARYISSEEGSKKWFTNLINRPIKLKDKVVGKTGIVEYSPKEKLKFKLKNIIGKVYKKLN